MKRWIYAFQLRNLHVTHEFRFWSVGPSHTTSRPFPVMYEGYCMSSTSLLQTMNPELETVHGVTPGVSMPVMPAPEVLKSD
eukprot:CAMPEP_0206221160 /NCGR_PEP_ID=MMETSP0047_2-20121206/5261_1 /ASSEMBLY_ACC=CAM_ASM_000192 /TAXON_ID=195065 /ORGANISM="Chroomonas mesostigmatica_cf, Strain CCMP1168" /LENGTH=80 /DNA_ID=CAMNT_0053643865 /DNA_START=224 /DNA_END=466 /DNA_ORIENTATION=+